MLQDQHNTLARLASNLAHLNPEAVLARGYSIVTNTDGAVVRDAATLPIGSTVRLRFQHGRAEASVTANNSDGNITD